MTTTRVILEMWAPTADASYIAVVPASGANLGVSAPVAGGTCVCATELVLATGVSESPSVSS